MSVLEESAEVKVLQLSECQLTAQKAAEGKHA